MIEKIEFSIFIFFLDFENTGETNSQTTTTTTATATETKSRLQEILQKVNLSALFEDFASMGVRYVEELRDPMIWGLTNEEIHNTFDELVEKHQLQDSQIQDLKDVIRFHQLVSRVSGTLSTILNSTRIH